MSTRAQKVEGVQSGTNWCYPSKKASGRRLLSNPTVILRGESSCTDVFPSTHAVLVAVPVVVMMVVMMVVMVEMMVVMKMKEEERECKVRRLHIQIYMFLLYNKVCLSGSLEMPPCDIIPFLGVLSSHFAPCSILSLNWVSPTKARGRSPLISVPALLLSCVIEILLHTHTLQSGKMMIQERFMF